MSLSNYTALKNVDIHAAPPWAALMLGAIPRIEADAKRWRQAAHDVAVANGVGPNDSVCRPYFKRAGRLDKRASMLAMGAALEIAGRDVANLDAEILSCFTKKGRHKSETIIRRLFKVSCWLEYEWERTIEKRLRRLVNEGRLWTDYGRTSDTLYLLPTPERVAAEAAEKATHAKHDALVKVRKARQAAVIDLLKSKGCESPTKHRYDDERVTMSVSDLEKLLGL